MTKQKCQFFRLKVRQMEATGADAEAAIKVHEHDQILVVDDVVARVYRGDLI